MEGRTDPSGRTDLPWGARCGCLDKGLYLGVRSVLPSTAVLQEWRRHPRGGQTWGALSGGGGEG